VPVLRNLRSCHINFIVSSFVDTWISIHIAT
jgi:hypothetical protein